MNKTRKFDRKYTKSHYECQSLPAFIDKTYKIVNNQQNHAIVRWSRNGQSFVIINRQRFSKEILPKYFKHNTIASFIRQLNMYDFHKLKNQDKLSIYEEFQHQYFQRNRLDLLEKIKRKAVHGTKKQLNQAASQLDYFKNQKNISLQLLDEVKIVKAKQSLIITNLNHLIDQNRQLWKEMYVNRQRVENKIQQLYVMFFSAMKSSIFKNTQKETVECKIPIPNEIEVANVPNDSKAMQIYPNEKQENKIKQQNMNNSNWQNFIKNFQQMSGPPDIHQNQPNFNNPSQTNFNLPFDQQFKEQQDKKMFNHLMSQFQQYNNGSQMTGNTGFDSYLQSHHQNMISPQKQNNISRLMNIDEMDQGQNIGNKRKYSDLQDMFEHNLTKQKKLQQIMPDPKNEMKLNPFKQDDDVQDDNKSNNSLFNITSQNHEIQANGNSQLTDLNISDILHSPILTRQESSSKVSNAVNYPKIQTSPQNKRIDMSMQNVQKIKKEEGNSLNNSQNHFQQQGQKLDYRKVNKQQRAKRQSRKK